MRHIAFYPFPDNAFIDTQTFRCFRTPHPTLCVRLCYHYFLIFAKELLNKSTSAEQRIFFLFVQFQK